MQTLPQRLLSANASVSERPRSGRIRIVSARNLHMAMAHRDPPITLHSDQGSTYATGSYREIVNRHGIRQSMSRKGDCWDNAPMERFFHTLKTELVMHCDYKTRDDARVSLFDYMEVFYNRQRRHSSIGYAAPLRFEATKSPGKVSIVRG